MRVGLVCAYALDVPGGVQRQVAELAARLGAAGIDAEVLAPGPAVDLADVGGAPGRRSSGAGRAVAVRGNGSVARIAPAAWSGPAYRRWVQAGRFDVVHLHEPLAPGLPQAVLGAAGHGGPPVVATVHATLGSPLAAAGLRLAAPVLGRRLRRAAAVTAVSATAAATAGRVLGAGTNAGVIVIGNGIEVGSAPERGGDGTPPTAVAVGRLDEPRKGVDVLLAAWPAVTRQVPEARLLLVGPGRPRGIPGGGLSAGVEVLGRVDEAGRIAALDAAHVAVAPHRGGESFGLVVAEAMARGLPVVASDLPAFRALMRGTDARGADPGVTDRCTDLSGGVLVRAGEPHALTDALVALLTDPVERLARGADGHRLAARHAWPRVTAQYLDLYRSIVTT